MAATMAEYDLASESPTRLSAMEAALAIHRGKLTVVQLAEACLARIAARPDIKAWAYIDRALVLEEARRLDAVPRDKRSSLHGIPVGIKDIFETKDMPTEYGCKRYKGNRTGKDADAVKRLHDKGCLIFGKCETVEFACGTKPLHPHTRNPHDTSRTPGGSSSGSAVSLAGSFSLVPSLDTIGFFARSPSDLILLAGMLDLPTEASDIEERPRLAWCRREGEGPAEDSARKALEQAVAVLKADGHPMEEIQLPEGFKDGARDMRNIFHKECVANFRPELDKGPEGIEAEKFEIVALGEGISEAQYQDSRQKIQELKRGYIRSMKGYDALLTFSVPHEAPVLDRAIGFSVFTSVWTALGMPAVNIPGWTGSTGMPLGLSLIGMPNQDIKLLRIAIGWTLLQVGWTGGVIREQAGQSRQLPSAVYVRRVSTSSSEHLMGLVNHQ